MFFREVLARLAVAEPVMNEQVEFDDNYEADDDELAP
jgi:hypothetical protein